MKFLRKTFMTAVSVILRLNGVSLSTRVTLKGRIKIGFVGEFGYALLGLLPFLNYASKNGASIQTFGLRGSSPFFYFSEKHTELPGLATSSWGTVKGAWGMRKYGSLISPIFVPVEWANRRLEIGGMTWESTKLHVQHPEYKNYAPLDFSQRSEKFSHLVDSFGEYFVLNVKNYQTFEGAYVPNWYFADEVVAILQIAKKKGFLLIINRSPVPPSENEPSEHQQFIEDLASSAEVLDLALHYEGLDWASANELQVSVLGGAQHVWATQGGNAMLALIVGSRCTILMRGGADWEDFSFLMNLYERKAEIIHRVEQSIFYRTEC